MKEPTSEYTSITRVDVQPEKTRVPLLGFTPWRDGPSGGILENNGPLPL